MSLERKSVHVRIAPDLYDRLKVMAEFHHKDVSDMAALWLEKEIVGEFHDFSLAAERMRRLGLSGSGRD